GSPLFVRATEVGESTKLAAIRHLMERAQAEKPPVVILADRVAGWFVALLLVLAVGAAGVWYALEPGRALWIFVSVLVVSCPCALSLATPAALTAATGALSRLGLLPTRGHAIETLANATHFVFDKTGTLTEGRLQLVETIPLADIGAASALEMAVALEGVSEHAIGAGFRDAAGGRDPAGAERVSAAVVTGQGIEGPLDGITYRIGRIDYVADLTGSSLPICGGEQAAETVVALGREGQWIALFRLRDRLRPTAAGLIKDLQAAGRHVCILSGDGGGAVAAVAAELGVGDAHSGLTPKEKHDYIVALQRGGAVVAMIGDGVNDAPVLAQAQVSIAMGSGTDLARNQGDMVLLAEDLGRIAEGLRIARQTSRIVRQNLGWAFAYNAMAIPAAMLGWITPWMAGIGMSASSLLVVLNALRLARGKASSTAGGAVAGTMC
ncbi:MAG: heavy metal translocating P-type ATPase, partial [Rhodocyclaceae bacterium]